MGANTTSYHDTGPCGGTVYWYKVLAYNGSGESGDSNTDSGYCDKSCGDTPIYDQWDNPSAVDVLSQDFEAVYDNFDNQTADDFELTQASTINTIELYGRFSQSGPVAGVNVSIYADNGGVPGALVYEALSVPPDNPSDPNLVIDLPTPAALFPNCH